MDDENDIVVDLFPGATNTNLLKETLADILPCTSYVLETIPFRRHFHLFLFFTSLNNIKLD